MYLYMFDNVTNPDYCRCKFVKCFCEVFQESVCVCLKESERERDGLHAGAERCFNLGHWI